MFDRLNKKQKIIFLATALVALILLSSILSRILNSDESKKVNYGSDTGETLITSSSISTNRIIYYELQDIVEKYINSYTVESEYSYDDYYSSLSDEYKSYLSKNKYKDLAENFLKKFDCTDDVDSSTRVCTDTILKSVYRYDTDKYICMLNSKSGQVAYIGILLNSTAKEKYAEIFYIE